MAKKARVYDGTAWQELASAQTDLTAYSTTAQISSTYATQLDFPAGAWTSYTPTLSNLTLGNGTLSAAYVKLGKLVVVRFRMVFGSTSSMGSFPGVTLPFTAAANLNDFFIGGTAFEDAGTTTWLGRSRLSSTSGFDFVFDTVSGTKVSYSFLSSTAPMTWATNDVIRSTFMYEAA